MRKSSYENELPINFSIGSSNICSTKILNITDHTKGEEYMMNIMEEIFNQPIVVDDFM